MLTAWLRSFFQGSAGFGSLAAALANGEAIPVKNPARRSRRYRDQGADPLRTPWGAQPEEVIVCARVRRRFWLALEPSP